MAKNKENTVSRLIHIPKKLNRDIERIKSDINYHEDSNMDLRDTTVELIRIGAKVKREELDKIEE